MAITATSTDRTVPPARRLVTILAVVVCLAGLNMFVGRLDYREFIPEMKAWVPGFFYNVDLKMTIWIAILCLFYILQVAFVSIFCGKSNDPAWLKWLIFGWIFVIIDAEILARIPMLGGVRGESFPFIGLFASQFGLLMTWLIVGTGHFVRRILMTVPPLVVMGMIFTVSEWSLLFPCLVVPLAIVLIAIRFWGFRLGVVADDIDGTESDRERSRQFSLSHAMILMTLIAILMSILKGLEAPLKAAIANVRSGESPIGLVLVLGFTSAIIAVVACWAALGFGRTKLRYGLLLGVVLASGVGVSLWGMYHWKQFQLKGGWMGVSSYELAYFAEARWFWMAWYFASGLLLVASLLFLRSQSFRLLRHAERS